MPGRTTPPQGRARFGRAGVRIGADVQHMVESAERTDQGLDILVNNAVSGSRCPGNHPWRSQATLALLQLARVSGLRHGKFVGAGQMMYCPKCSEQRGQWVLPPRDLGYLSAGQLGNTLAHPETGH